MFGFLSILSIISMVLDSIVCRPLFNFLKIQKIYLVHLSFCSLFSDRVYSQFKFFIYLLFVSCFEMVKCVTLYHFSLQHLKMFSHRKDALKEKKYLRLINISHVQPGTTAQKKPSSSSVIFLTRGCAILLCFFFIFNITFEFLSMCNI